MKITRRLLFVFDSSSFLCRGFFRCLLSENAGEDSVDVAKLALQVEGARERFVVEVFRDARVRGHAVTKACVRFPSCRRLILHGFIRVVAWYPSFHQVL